MKFIYKEDGQTKPLHIKISHRPHIGEFIKYDKKLFKIISITHIVSEHGHLLVECDKQ